MASLDVTLTTVLATAERLKATGAAGNEANTRALLIDPVLAALGWNLLDIDEVEREFRVYDGTFLDYALRLGAKPRLFVEAKAMNKSLADKAFVAQTVNYANNEGVLWCVLTNGLVYQVYKSNEPVDMERKLLFEVDVREGADDAQRRDVARSLQMLSKEAVEAGQLDAWGEEVFIDVRTRAALAKLGQAPSASFIRAVSTAIEGPPIDSVRLKASLARTLGKGVTPLATAPVVGSPPPKTPKPPTAAPVAPKAQYDIDRHLAGKPSAIVDLFERLDALGLSLGPDVTRRPAKWYIGYYAGKRSLFTATLQKAKILVYISIAPAEVQPWDEESMRDVTSIGHLGLGGTEFVLRSGDDQLTALEPLLRQSYLRNRK